MADEKKAKKTAKNADNKSEKKKSGKNPFKSIGSFFKSVRSEGKKIVWPKGAEVWKNTLVVLGVILILGLIIFGIDQALTQGMKAVKNYANSRTSVVAESDADTSEDALSDLLNGDTDEEDTDADAVDDTAETDDNTEATDDTSTDTTDAAD